MRRRDLLALAAGMSALRPPAGWAQPAKVPVVGVLVYSPNPSGFLAGLREGLKKLGYVEGQNIRLDIRSAEGKAERLAELAADLVREKVDVIVAIQTPAVLAAKHATSDTPIVMAGAGAPVEAGLVASLARPGGNITGTSSTAAELAQKNLQILQEILPSVRRVGIMLNAADPAFGKVLLAQNQEAGAKLGIDLVPLPAKNPDGADAAFAAAVRERVEAVVIQPVSATSGQPSWPSPTGCRGCRPAAASPLPAAWSPRPSTWPICGPRSQSLSIRS